ncbi:Vps52 / Sac2 family [Actinidia rufa]|uniref:Vps52 / Sac2 family n=1 Tax=Actinidia rufa TaxID=165716 RepID=A0A7J0F965_9ERIC|nr:Vps52 / Sac2 family [Actinidia rufa]
MKDATLRKVGKRSQSGEDMETDLVDESIMLDIAISMSKANFTAKPIVFFSLLLCLAPHEARSHIVFLEGSFLSFVTGYVCMLELEEEGWGSQVMRAFSFTTRKSQQKYNGKEYLCYLDSGAGTNLGVGHVKSKNRGYADMDPNLDTSAGIRHRLTENEQQRSFSLLSLTHRSFGYALCHIFTDRLSPDFDSPPGLRLVLDLPLTRLDFVRFGLGVFDLCPICSGSGRSGNLLQLRSRPRQLCPRENGRVLTQISHPYPCRVVSTRVLEFIVQKLYALRKPKTNIQILQQSVLLKYKYIISFLKEHGKEVYTEVRAAYIDTMNKVLSAHFRAYIQALEKLQLDIATYSDLIGVETRSTGLFSRGREPLKNRSAVFALGERINILKEIDEPALIPHIAEASSHKYPYEVLFRSLHKLLMDTASSEYLFCDDFFGEESIFYEIFAGPFTVIDEHFSTILPNCFDAIGLMLMIRIIHQHQGLNSIKVANRLAVTCSFPSQLVMSRRRIPCLDSYLDKVNISLWPRFKMVFDMHLNSLRNAIVKTLWEDDVHPHYVMRRYAEFTASLIHINVEYGDGQLELNLERLRMAVDDLLVKLAKMFPKPKLQTVFLINNYDMTIAVLKEAGPEGGKIQMHFEELLKNNTTIFVEELLLEHFSDLIKFVKTRASEDPTSGLERPITVSEVEPLVKDFASRWKAAIELMHNDVITSFSNFLCGMEILRAALTQLLLYYTRLSDCIKRIVGGSALNKDLVSISSIMYEIRKYSRTF